MTQKNKKYTVVKYTKEEEKQAYRYFYTIVGIIIFGLLAWSCNPSKTDRAASACMAALRDAASYGDPEILTWEAFGNKQTGEPSYIVIHAKMQNGFGAWSRQSVTCYPVKQPDGSYVGII